MNLAFWRKSKRNIVVKPKTTRASRRAAKRRKALPAAQENSNPEEEDNNNGSLSKASAARERIVMGARADAIKVFRKMKNQFSDPNKCYRELVQNGMDSGSDRMYFGFDIAYPLRGKNIDRYLRLFDDEISLAGSSIKEVHQKLRESGLDELVIDTECECKMLQEMLGEHYSESQKEPKYALRKDHSRFNSKQKYLDVILKKWRILIPPEGKEKILNKKSIVIDRYGFSSQVCKIIGNPMEKIRYYDKIVRHNAGVKHGHLPGSSRHVIASGWDQLLDRRYAFLQQLINTDGQFHPELMELIEENKAEYSRRMLLSWVGEEKPKKMRINEKNFFSNLSGLNPLPTSLDSIVRNNALANLQITAEDFGVGMTNNDREEFLKKIFGTSKADDLEQTGRFGVGFISVFAFDPDEVIVESARAGEAWEYHFLRETEDSLPGELYEPEFPREKGTKVTIAINHRNSEDIRQVIKDAEKHITNDCSHREEPIYVSGKKINQDFDIPAKIKVRFGRRGVEGIVGLVGRGNGEYTLENNRIVLEEKIAPLAKCFKDKPFGYQILVSSRYLNYDIGRENVERDANFTHIVRLVQAQEDNIAREVFNTLEEELRGKTIDRDELDLCWTFAKYYIGKKSPESKRRKKKFKQLIRQLPDDILATKVIETIGEEQWTMRQFLEFCRTEDRFHIADKSSELTDMLGKKGKQIFKRPQQGTFSYQRTRWLEMFGKAELVGESYQSSSVSTELNEDEQAFLDTFSKRLQKSPLRRQFPQVVGSYFPHNKYKLDDIPFRRVTLGPVTCRTSNTLGGNFYYEIKRPNPNDNMAKPRRSYREMMKAGLIGIWNNYLSGSMSSSAIALNFDSSYIRRLMRHEQIFQDNFAHNLLLQSIAQSEYGPSYQVATFLFREEEKRLGTYKHDYQATKEQLIEQDRIAKEKKQKEAENIAP